mmetsp:Transcript_74664/g.175210  ORF Transcript_74664/g.175210 Transcript_74664/m.175210 type:complete len:119 (-) Transcript_74664:974-1330(-)
MCSGQGASAPDLSPPWVQLLTVSTLVTDEDGEASDSGSFGGGVEVDVMATGGSDDVMATDDDDATFGPPVPDGLGVAARWPNSDLHGVNPAEEVMTGLLGRAEGDAMEDVDSGEQRTD